jgi:alanine dehydrogenase
VERAIRSDAGLIRGVNVKDGRITCQGVADAHGLRYDPLS